MSLGIKGKGLESFKNLVRIAVEDMYSDIIDHVSCMDEKDIKTYRKMLKEADKEGCSQDEIDFRLFNIILIANASNHLVKEYVRYVFHYVSMTYSNPKLAKAVEDIYIKVKNDCF